MPLLNPQNFPNAEIEGCTKSSEQSRFYNCIAWASEEDGRHWWPNSTMAYWPEDVPAKTTVNAFLRLFEKQGYKKCADGSHEKGCEKVAIYALKFVVTHAARQLPNGRWTSKIGIENIDIEHNSTEALEGPFYGEVVRYLMRPEA